MHSVAARQDAEFLTALILQRTAPFIALGGKDALREWTRTGNTQQLLAVLADPAARLQYLKDAFAEIAGDVEDYLGLLGDARPRRIVSIGAGNGIAEAALAARLRPESFLLVDKERGGHGHGFSADAAGYGSLETARMLLREGGFDGEILLWNPTLDNEPAYPFDLCISMFAMGFHFPADSYDSFIFANAQPGAVVIYDCRALRGFRSRTVMRKA